MELLLPILRILSFVLVLAFLVLTFRSDYTGERDLTTSRGRQ